MTGSNGSIDTSYNNDRTKCKCLPNFPWDNPTKTCKIDCTTPGSTGSNTTATQCGCTTGYAWNTTINMCVRSLCATMSGSDGVDPANNLICKCKPNWSWSYS